MRETRPFFSNWKIQKNFKKPYPKIKFVGDCQQEVEEGEKWSQGGIHIPHGQMRGRGVHDMTVNLPLILICMILYLIPFFHF